MVRTFLVHSVTSQKYEKNQLIDNKSVRGLYVHISYIFDKINDE